MVKIGLHTHRCDFGWGPRAVASVKHVSVGSWIRKVRIIIIVEIVVGSRIRKVRVCVVVEVAVPWALLYRGPRLHLGCTLKVWVLIGMGPPSLTVIIGPQRRCHVPTVLCVFGFRVFCYGGFNLEVIDHNVQGLIEASWILCPHERS